MTVVSVSQGRPRLECDGRGPDISGRPMQLYAEGLNAVGSQIAMCARDKNLIAHPDVSRNRERHGNPRRVASLSKARAETKKCRQPERDQ